MSKQAIFGLAATHAQAEHIVNDLKSANFSNKDISVLFPDKKATESFSKEKQTKAPQGAIAGASTGVVVGGTLGWIAGIGALAIPGVGPFIAAGPIIAAISGVAVGAAVGGITGGLIGLGISETEAKHYADEVKKGKILISVHSENPEQLAQAKEIFSKAGAECITTTGVLPVTKGKKVRDAVPHGHLPSAVDWAPAGDPVGFSRKV